MADGFLKGKNIMSMGRSIKSPEESFQDKFTPKGGPLMGPKPDNPNVAAIERWSGAKFGTEEYFQWLDEHPALNFLKSGEQLNEYSLEDPYRISEETQKIFESTQEAGGIIRGQAEESVDVAESQRGMVDMPGGGLQREAAQESTAAAVSSAQTAGGSSTSALGAIAQIQSGNISSMRDAAIQTQVFRDQSEKEYIQALREQGGAEVSAIQTEVQGWQAMGQAKETQYQTNILDPWYAKNQADLQMAAAKAAKPDRQKVFGIF